MKLAECIQLKDIVFNLDSRIRYFGYMDNRQGMIVSELRNKEESHPGENQLVRDLTFFKGAMASWSLYFGQVNYALVSHDRFSILMVPAEAGLVIVTAESSISSDFLASLAKTVRKNLPAALGKL